MKSKRLEAERLWPYQQIVIVLDRDAAECQQRIDNTYRTIGLRKKLNVTK